MGEESEVQTAWTFYQMSFTEVHTEWKNPIVLSKPLREQPFV